MRTVRFLEPDYFFELRDACFKHLRKDDHLFLTLSGELSTFIRLNNAKIRQAGEVEQAYIGLNLVTKEGSGALKKATRSCSLSGEKQIDISRLNFLINELQTEVVNLPVDPFAVLPQTGKSSQTEKRGHLLPESDVISSLLKVPAALDLTGLYTSGLSIQAMANSAGLSHWFSTESFAFDYSLFTAKQKAVKGLLGGTEWNQNRYEKKLKEDAAKLSLLERPSKKLCPGEYRAYLAPHALNDFVGMFSWGAVSEASIQQGDSPLRKLRAGEQKLSPLFSLSEDFSGGEVPRFNEEGLLAPEKIEIISEGLLKQSLVSSRSALEYKLEANGATLSEGLRSFAVNAGSLEEDKVLQTLNEGLYLSNLHYLNWSDQPEGRITGMTRYACFWVKDGQLQEPIENLRFDDSIFRVLGSELQALTRQREIFPDVSTYDMRSLGHAKLPGAIISKMKFTL